MVIIILLSYQIQYVKYLQYIKSYSELIRVQISHISENGTNKTRTAVRLQYNNIYLVNTKIPISIKVDKTSEIYLLYITDSKTIRDTSVLLE